MNLGYWGFGVLENWGIGDIRVFDTRTSGG